MEILADCPGKIGGGKITFVHEQETAKSEIINGDVPVFVML